MKKITIILSIASILLITGFAPKDNSQYEQQLNALVQKIDNLEKGISSAEQRLAAIKEARKKGNDVFVNVAKELENTGTKEDSDQKAIEDIDVETEVELIRGQYSSIVNLIQNDKCEAVTIDKDVTGYLSSDMSAIYIKKGFGGNNYNRQYYFKDGILFFAYYEADDAHRLYFKNDKMIRWRYSKDAADAQNAINHDGDNAVGYDQMEESAIEEAYSLLDKTDASESNDTEFVYSEDDAIRMFTNYFKEVIGLEEGEALDVMAFLDGDIYSIDAFMDNETDSMHPVKAGSATMDPNTGIGEFNVWGELTPVDFKKYDY